MRGYLDDLFEVRDKLVASGTILCPTDTIWGISCDAFNSEALDKVYDIKRRDKDKPFIILVDSIERLKKYVVHVHPRIETLIHYHLRPLSIIYKANEALPQHLVSPQGTVAIRVIKDHILTDLIELLGRPIISTSANISSDTAPQKFEEIKPQIIDQVDYIFKTGRNNKKSEMSSMIISFDEEGELSFLRQ